MVTLPASRRRISTLSRTTDDTETEKPSEAPPSFDPKQAFDAEVARDVLTPTEPTPTKPTPTKPTPDPFPLTMNVDDKAVDIEIEAGYEGPLSANQMEALGPGIDAPEQSKEGPLSQEEMEQLMALPDAIPTIHSKTEQELKDSLDYIEPIPPWELPEPPGIGSRLWYQLTGQERPPDEYNLSRTGATITGSILGAHIGAQIGSKIPPIPFAPWINPITGGLVFSGVGALAGTVMPEATLEIGETLGLLPDGYREKHAFSNARLLYEAENEAMLDVATGGAITTAQGAWRLAGRFLSNADSESIRMASEIRKKFNVNLMPIQLGRRSIARGFSAVFGRMPWIGTRIQTIGLKTAEQLTEAYKTLGQKAFSRVNALRADNEISEMIFRDGKDLMSAFDKKFGEWYEKAWKLADEANVRVRPVFIKLRAKDILKDLDRVATTTADGKKIDGEVLAKVRDFINKRVTILDNEQSLRQIDGFIGQIDQMLASLDGHQVKYAQNLMGRLRVAASYDMLKHAVGAEASNITRYIRQIDYQFSYTMNSLFESVTSRKFENVYRGGLRQNTSLSKQATKINIDQLAKYVIDLDSPMAVEQLWKLTSKETFEAVVSRTLDDAVQKARKVNADGTEEFFSDRLAKHLGIEAGTVSSKRTSLEKMLKLSKSGLNIKDIEMLIVATKQIESLDLPVASTYLARRLQIAGFKSAVKGLLPGFLVGGAATGVTAMFTGMIGVGFLLGGGKLLSRMVTDPKSAMLFKEVAKTDAHIIANWKLIPQVLRLTISSLAGDGSIGAEEAKQLNELAGSLTDDLKQQYLEIFPPGSTADVGYLGEKLLRETKEKAVKKIKIRKQRSVE